MKSPSALIALLLTAVMTSSLSAYGQVEARRPNTPANVKGAADKAAIAKVLTAYGAALNASDGTKIASLFTTNAVVLPPGSPTAQGRAQILAMYKGMGAALGFNLQFTLGEIVVASENYAFASSTSKGTMRTKASGQTTPSVNRESWVFAKEAGQWKIARYMFNQPK